MTVADSVLSGSSFLHRRLANALSANWWVVLLRGVIAIAFGLVAMIRPLEATIGVAIGWGAYALADGILAIVMSFATRGLAFSSRAWMFVVGFAGVAAGVLAFIYPGITAATLAIIVAIWAMVLGFGQIWGGITLRKEMKGEWLLISSGVVAVLCGVALIFRPALGAVALTMVLGVYAFAFGIVLLVLAFRLKGLKKDA